MINHVSSRVLRDDFVDVDVPSSIDPYLTNEDEDDEGAGSLRSNDLNASRPVSSSARSRPAMGGVHRGSGDLVDAAASEGAFSLDDGMNVYEEMQMGPATGEKKIDF